MIDGKLVIAIDFDGTIATLSYPEVGDLIKNADKCIRLLYDEGHHIVINTCRSGKHEGLAQDFLDNHKIPYDLINANLPELITYFKQDCRKISADIYIDDKCLFELPPWEDIYNIIQAKWIKLKEDEAKK